MIRVLIVDDQSLIRGALTAILSGAAGIELIGHAVNGFEAVDLTRRLHPDVVLMDIRMPGKDGIQATAEICRDPDLAGTRILIFTTFEEDHYVAAALVAGASGFLGKGADPDEITHAIHIIHSGDALLSPAATGALIARYLASPHHLSLSPAVLEPLTVREQEILALVGRGYTNEEIASELVISPHTAKTHIGRIMTKLTAHDRAQLVIHAYESGLITPGQP